MAQLIADYSGTGANGSLTYVAVDQAEEHGRPSKRARIQNPHECLTCNTSYTDRRSLLRHQRTRAHCEKTGQPINNHGCEECGKRFARQDNLHRHVQEVHLSRRRGGQKVNTTAELPRIELQSSVSDDRQPASVEELGKRCSRRPSLHSVSTGDTSGMDNPGLSMTTSDTLSSKSSSFQDDQVETQYYGIGPVDFTVEKRQHPERNAVACLNSPGAQASDTLSDTGTEPIREIYSVRNSFDIPIRGGVSQRKPLRNHKFRPIKRPRPCPLCRIELQAWEADNIDDVQKVQAHMDTHLAELGGAELPGTFAELSCKLCNISFTHLKDLQWHLHNVEKQGTCGYSFSHSASCTGHHPASNGTAQHHDRQGFMDRLQEWERAQLLDFKSYVEEHANGLIPTNAPVYGTSRFMFSQSTGSLISAHSKLTWRSLPEYVKVETRPVKTTLFGKAAQKVSRIVSERRHSPQSNLLRAVEMRQLDWVADLITKHSFYWPDFKPLVRTTLRDGDLEILKVLLAHQPGITEILIEQVLQDTDECEDQDMRRIVHSSLANDDAEVLKILMNQEAVIKSCSIAQLLAHSVEYSSVVIMEILVTEALRFLGYFDALALESELSLDLGESTSVIEVAGDDCNEDFLENIQPDILPYKSWYLSAAQDCDARFISPEEYKDSIDVSLRKALQYLLYHGHNVDAVDKHGNTLICLATHAGRVNIIEYLLEHNASTLIRYKGGDTILHIAARCENNVLVLAMLLRHVAEVNVPNARGDTALHLVARQPDNSEAINLLLLHDADVLLVNIQGETALHLAARYNKSAIEGILFSGADLSAVDHRGDTPLHIVARSSEAFEAIQALILHGSDVHATNHQGETILQLACSLGTVDTAEFLLQAGADLNMVDFSNSSALHCAASGGNTLVADLLLQYGALPLATDLQGRTPLHAAAFHGHGATIEVLLRAGADLESTDEIGWTPLHFAVLHSNVRAVEVLLFHGADVSSRSSDGRTPLHTAFAVSPHNMRIIEMLLYHRADVFAIDGFGMTAIQYVTAPSSTLKRLMQKHLGMQASSQATFSGNRLVNQAFRSERARFADMQ